jgi:magnesium-protoporphyrin IX monomethyl ester (oxidative) cyclase
LESAGHQPAGQRLQSIEAKVQRMKQIKRILLVEPPVTRPAEFSATRVRISPFFPLGLGYLSAVLIPLGYEVLLLDALMKGIERGEQAYGEGMVRYGLTDEEIGCEIEAFKPDVVGVSAVFSAKDFDAKNVCRISKNTLPRVPTVMGGAYAGAAHRELLAGENALDYVVIGEGEQAFTQLLRAMDAGQDCEKIDGLAYRINGKPRFNPKSSYIQDLDTIPFPARELVDMEKYFRLGVAHDRFRYRPFTQMITSRGCPFRCTFCTLSQHWGRVQRLRSAGNVLKEIDVLVKQYGVREIHFEDDNLTADKPRALAIFRGLRERGYNIAWTVPTGMSVATLDEGLLHEMAASGCYSVSLGIESGNQEVLSRLMRKPVNLKKVPGLVKAIRDHGMLARGFFMIGYPGETRKTIKETIAFARSLELDWSFFFVATPLPHTEMYDMALRQGYLHAGDFNPVTAMHESVIKTPEFDNEYLTEIREEAIRDLNFRNNPNLTKFNVDQAIEDFEHVIGLYPHFDFAHEALGDAYRRKGIPEKACECWRRAIDANSENASAATKLREFCSK